MRKTIGALTIAAPFAAIAAIASMRAGAWWLGPAAVVGTLALIALIVVGVLLLMGE